MLYLFVILVALYVLSKYRACAVAANNKSPRTETDSGLADGDNALNLTMCRLWPKIASFKT